MRLDGKLLGSGRRFHTATLLIVRQSVPDSALDNAVVLA